MSSRKRKSVSPSFDLPSTNSIRINTTNPSDDPDFLALSTVQRRRIDEAFQWGLEEYGARKKSKIVGVGDGDVGMEMGGGGGGFEVEDDMSGDGGGGGGFFPSGSTSPPPQQSYLSLHTTDTSNSNLLPLSSLPSVMNLLNLSVDDDVLTIFDSFNGTGLLDDDNNNDDDSMNQGKIAGYTNIKDFRAVCAAMMEVEPEPEADGEEEGMQVDDAGPSSSDDGDSKDEYKENSSDLSSEEDEIQGPKTNNGNTSMDIIDSDSSPKKVRRTRKTPTTTSSTPASNTNTKNTIRSTKPTTTSIPPPTKRLTAIQREHIQQLWDQMFSMTNEKDMKHYGGGAGAGTGGNGTTYGRVLGKEQVGKWSKEMGEEWSDVEITEMIELFSTQPGKRGLGYDDFSALLVRGGLI